MTLFHDYLRVCLDGPQGTPGRITFLAKVQARKPSFTRDEIVIPRGEKINLAAYLLFITQVRVTHHSTRKT